MKNVALIFGGESAEREISIVTAMQLEEMCDKNKYKLFCVVADENGNFFWCKNGIDSQACANCNFDSKNYVRVEFAFGKMWGMFGKKLKAIADVDCAIIACHGGKGENGELVAHLNIAKIKTSVGGVEALQIAMDKTISKQILKGKGIPVAIGFDFFDNEWLNCCESVVERVENEVGYPAVVKPARQGSSVGITYVENKNELCEAVELALEYDNKILVEKAVKNFREFNVSVIRRDCETLVSEIEEAEKSGAILTFSDKYFGGAKKDKFQKCLPKMSKYCKNSQKFGQKCCKTGNGLFLNGNKNSVKNIDEDVAAQIKNYAKAAVCCIEFFGVCRIDFLVDDLGKVYLNEINSVPGSLAYYFWNGFNVFDKLVEVAVNSSTAGKKTLIAKFL